MWRGTTCTRCCMAGQNRWLRSTPLSIACWRSTSSRCAIAAWTGRSIVCSNWCAKAADGTIAGGSGTRLGRGCVLEKSRSVVSREESGPGILGLLYGRLLLRCRLFGLLLSLQSVSAGFPFQRTSHRPGQRRTDAGRADRHAACRRAGTQDRAAAGALVLLCGRSAGGRSARLLDVGARADRSRISGGGGDVRVDGEFSARGRKPHDREKPNPGDQPHFLCWRRHERAGRRDLRIPAAMAADGRVLNAVGGSEAADPAGLVRAGRGGNARGITAALADASRRWGNRGLRMERRRVAARFQAECISLAVFAVYGAVVGGAGGVHSLRQRLFVARSASSADAYRADLL